MSAIVVKRWTAAQHRRKSAAAMLMWQRRREGLRRTYWGAILLSEMG